MKLLDVAQMQVLEARPRVSGSRIGTIVAMKAGPVVDFPGNPLGPQPARSVSSMSAQALSEAHKAALPVLLVFDRDDPARPVIVDIVIDPPMSVTSARRSGMANICPEGSADVVDNSRHATGARLATIAAIQGDVVLVSCVEAERSGFRPESLCRCAT